MITPPTEIMAVLGCFAQVLAISLGYGWLLRNADLITWTVKVIDQGNVGAYAILMRLPRPEGLTDRAIALKCNFL